MGETTSCGFHAAAGIKCLMPVFLRVYPIWASNVASNSDKSKKSKPKIKKTWSKSFLNHLHFTHPPPKGSNLRKLSPCWCANFFIFFQIRSAAWTEEAAAASSADAAKKKRRRWATNVAWLAWFFWNLTHLLKHPSSYPNPNPNQQLLRWFRSGTSTDTSLAISWWPLLPLNMPSQRGDNWGGQEAFHMKVRDSHRP